MHLLRAKSVSNHRLLLLLPSLLVIGCSFLSRVTALSATLTPTLSSTCSGYSVVIGCQGWGACVCARTLSQASCEIAEICNLPRVPISVLIVSTVASLASTREVSHIFLVSVCAPLARGTNLSAPRTGPQGANLGNYLSSYDNQVVSANFTVSGQQSCPLQCRGNLYVRV